MGMALFVFKPSAKQPTRLGLVAALLFVSISHSALTQSPTAPLNAPEFAHDSPSSGRTEATVESNPTNVQPATIDQPSLATKPEFRGLWVDAFGPGFFNADQVKKLVSDCRTYN